MSTLIVFSHPNHELAVFGYLQKLKPHLLFLTDGGGEARVEQTRLGLDSIDLLDKAHFLDHTEDSFYDALLRCDSQFFADVANEVRSQVDVIAAQEVLCDAVEFYNPVHDISLPLVLAALRGRSGPEVLEVPLIHQQSAGAEKFIVQRLPASRASEQIELQLSEAEVAVKQRARDEIYTILSDQLGEVVLGLPNSHLRMEVMAAARRSVPEPGPDVMLRYDQRASLLAATGKIEHRITYDQHYVSVASPLMQ